MEAFFHVEAQLQRKCNRPLCEVKELVATWIQKLKDSRGELFEFSDDGDFTVQELDAAMSEDIQCLTISFYGSPLFKSLDSSFKQPKIWRSQFNSASYVLHPYKLEDYSSMEGCHEDTDAPCSLHIELPSVRFEGLWESLMFEEEIKNRLINFASTAILFSDRGVNSNCINFNRVALLHGPPGTGKTSLCKGLAQKLAIRLKRRFKQIQLVEINAHSLFSKYFSESGKLVIKLFERITEFINNANNMVFILIDEVESLVQNRERSMNGSDPSDALRVVNALLTQIDVIRSNPNVVILATSNITTAIDAAFLDRADIKQYIGLPPLHIVYEIYRSCINELARKSIVKQSDSLLPYCLVINLASNFPDNRFQDSGTLYKISQKSLGFSGRTLRKIPFLTMCHFSQKSSLDLHIYLDMLSKTVEAQLSDIQSVKGK